MFAQDEAISKMNVEKLRKLKPFFRPQGGTITGGRAGGWLVSYRLGAFAMLLPPWHVWQHTKGKSGCKCHSSLQHLGRGYIETAQPAL